jgi:hypothetical protein
MGQEHPVRSGADVWDWSAHRRHEPPSGSEGPEWGVVGHDGQRAPVLALQSGRPKCTLQSGVSRRAGAMRARGVVFGVIRWYVRG